MSCSRKECSNIMCDTYVNGIGYVCDDCQEDFKRCLSNKSIEAATEGQIRKELKAFMATTKEETYNDGKEISVSEFFKEHTK